MEYRKSDIKVARKQLLSWRQQLSKEDFCSLCFYIVTVGMAPVHINLCMGTDCNYRVFHSMKALLTVSKFYSNGNRVDFGTTANALEWLEEPEECNCLNIRKDDRWQIVEIEEEFKRLFNQELIYPWER